MNRSIKETTMCNAKNRVHSANAFMYTLVDESISFFPVNPSGSNYSWHGSRNRRKKKMCKRRNDITTLASHTRKFYLGTNFM